MYSKNSGPKRPFHGGSSGASHGGSHGGKRFGGSRRSFHGGGNRGGGNRFKGVHIDVSKFIKKAVVQEEVPEYVPTHKFVDFAIQENLKVNIVAKGYVTPTPIQDKIIPHILAGRDVVGIANTGTGKTAAFLIPLINKVLLNHKENTLIIVPTRELALQIEQELKAFVKNMKIFSVSCIGGAPIGPQIKLLRYHNNFVIGTPGRLKDLIERKCLFMNEFNTIVLDEADRMLDMGFINDMKYVMKLMPEKRHTLFFSATLSSDIEALIKNFLKDPVKVSVKTQDTAANVDQDVIRVGSPEKKMETLHDLLKKADFHKVLIFGRTKHGVEKLSISLGQRGFKVESIHGDKNHTKRQKALALFKDNKIQVLVATDVAARGLDIANVSHVINYDIPATYEDYVHRIGRTGRGGKKGKALTFVG